MDLLPLFPLPDAVLFPHVFLPLHVFEPRYREMVSDALQGDRLIGMVLLRPGWKADYEGRPPVYPIGCIGVITHVARLDDGRFNIVLRGMERFRILSENHDRAYRRAVYETLAELAPAADDGRLMARHRERLDAMLPAMTGKAPAPAFGSRLGTRAVPTSTGGMNNEEFINALAQYLEFDPIEKQALLEQGGLRARAESLLELMEMKRLVAHMPGQPGVAH